MIPKGSSASLSLGDLVQFRGVGHWSTFTVCLSFIFIWCPRPSSQQYGKGTESPGVVDFFFK